VLGSISLILCACSLSSYLIPLIILAFSPTQNLKTKYNASWALVTGASSGIGRALCFKLASQDLNIVLVALDDQMLSNTIKDLKIQFPSLQFRAVGVDLGGDPNAYMDKIIKSTTDIQVSIVLNNAGYLLMGFFRQNAVEKHLANVECNVLSSVRITHYFLQHMIQHKIHGCISFTSSAVWFLPAPFAVLYGAGKAFLSEFAVSLAVEAADHKIDIFCVHPSFTRTNLYANTPKLSILSFLDKFGHTPETVADAVVSAIGRTVMLDLGWYAVVTKLAPRVLDISVLVLLMIPFRKLIPEYKVFSKR